MEQKQLRLEVAQDMLDSANSDPEFLYIVTTGDESWVYGYDPETKALSSFSLKITMRRAQRIHPHSHVGCTLLTQSADGKKSMYAHKGTLHLTTTAHFTCFISFRGKKSRRIIFEQPT
jgi:hypothetical protein